MKEAILKNRSPMYIYTMARKLNPSKDPPKKDIVYTPENLALQIVDYFKPWGFILEPCKGQGAFLKPLEKYATQLFWAEIEEGRDFLTDDLLDIGLWNNYNWIVTNPPYSKLRDFLIKSMKVADNIVFLCPINTILGLKARLRDIDEHGFFVREILRVEKPKEWPSSGFEYAAIYLNKEPGDCKISKLTT